VSNFLAVLRERGFLHQTTDDEAVEKPLQKLLESRRVTGYVGFDPTAPSLHVGNLVPVMGLAHLQRSGHRPLVILGGGTGLIGDPSGKTEMRKMLDSGEAVTNLELQRTQIGKYLDLAPGGGPSAADPAEGRGLVLNNAEWLQPLNYIEFLRQFGRHFSVNRMLAADSVQLRLNSEGGLSFLEFNYGLLQAYDFFVLNERYGCELQLGGSDQWGNIVAGIELIRRAAGRKAHGITFPLITTASGGKMGKTETGAVWLDPERTSPYHYYQYWINTDDRDVGRFLRLFTLLSITEIQELEGLKGADIRRAKERLAFEATALSHGKEAASRAQEGARSLFGGGVAAGESASVPTYQVARSLLEAGIPAVQLFSETGMTKSRNEARRLAGQKGLYVNDQPIAEDRVLSSKDLKDGALLLQVGKKKHLKIVPE
jgi:tyrosyl-tRNA synthetase